ncbi:hypothetical protein C5167_021031 [Papaver somniferum]|uniref:Eukaryotic translation initiation factor 3 subunit B n=1 Tax=Papaver somniferum TaxID=3469 RepID=A0A4Y7IUQ1_PAPSO|nr:hypothetical protein C5167_021031 [Papaver somniferum]
MAELMSMGDIEAFRGDLDSIQLPSGEDFGIPSDDDEYEEELNNKYDLKNKSGFGNIIVVDNLPVVTAEKYNKMIGVIKRISGVTDEGQLWMPVDPETQKSLGYCFIEYDTPQEAELAIQRTNKYKLDRAHILALNGFKDFDRFMELADEWAAPEIKPYIPGENLQQWLTDVKARDQFVIRAGNDTEIFWNNPRQSGPDLWSSHGTYFATVHTKGVAVWGGAATFDRLSSCAHPQVKLIDFSPGEKYLVTYSSHEYGSRFETHNVILNIFDVITRKVMRDFEGSADEFTIGGTGDVSGFSWPFFRWGGGKDDKYFARIGKNVISVYETENFTLIDKKSLKVENVLDFSWSPADPIIALFVPELDGGNKPARLSLVQIPGKYELRQKNLFSVTDCKMYWQSNGEYLAVKVVRYTKTRKSTCASFELFRMKERDIPIEVLELESKNDNIMAFAWEPKGHRFAIIHGEARKVDVSFYSMRTATCTGRVSKLTTLQAKNASALHWSPSGHFIVLSGLNGQLEFYDVDELATMATAEHFMATNIEWDPTGRYVATAVTSVHEMENGFHIWSFTGKLLYKISKDHFHQFLWRPRPPSFLTAEMEEQISKNLDEYSKKYETEDQDAVTQLRRKDREKRKMLQEEWDSWIQKWKQLHEEEKLERQLLRDGQASDDDEEEYEAEAVEVEEVLDVRQEIVPYEFDHEQF